MIRGLPASLFFHAAVIGAGYVVWPFVSANRAAETELVIVPVELLELGEVTNIAAVREPQDEPETEEIAPEEVEEPPVEDFVEEPDPVDETLPEDEVDTAREVAPPEEAEPEDVLPDFDSEPDPEATEPEAEQDEPRSAVQDTANPLADFLNSADSTFQSERQTRKRQEDPPRPPQRLLEDTPPASREVTRGAGERTGNTARLEALFYNQVEPCTISVRDLPNYNELNVRLAVELDREGNVISRRLVDPARRPLGRVPMRTAIERAERAVEKCAPYRLPDDEYETWKSVNVNIGPAFGLDK